MQGALPPHPTLLVFTNINQAYTDTVKLGHLAYLGGPRGAIEFLAFVFSNDRYVCEITVNTRNLSIMDAPGVHSPFRGSLFANLNVRQADAASDAASVSKHRVDVCGHGGQVYTSFLGGPGGECRFLEVSFCEYAMRGSPMPHRTVPRSPSTK